MLPKALGRLGRRPHSHQTHSIERAVLQEITVDKKQESSKPEKSDQRPAAPQNGELAEKQLDKVTGGGGGGTIGGPHPVGPGPGG